MRKTTLLLAPILLFATNGDNLIGAGAVSRGTGGSTISSYIGIESIFLNPATIVEAKRSRIEGGITYFHPVVKARNLSSSSNFVRSRASDEYIPYFGYVRPLNNKEAIGIGLFSVSGMGVKYHDQTLAKMQTSFKYAKASFAYAKEWGNLRIGAALHIALAQLQMDASLPSPRGGKRGNDIGVGYHIGALYKLDPLHLSITYTSKTPMTYKSVFDFDGDGRYEDMKLTQPAEIAVGAAFNLNKTKISIMAKRILWHQARGYREFGWRDQNVFAAGVMHRWEDLCLRGGINFSSSPLKSFADPNQAFFNIVGFPAISKRHYTLGLGYRIDPDTSLEIAYIYSPKERISGYGFEATNTQHSLSLGVAHSF